MARRQNVGQKGMTMRSQITFLYYHDLQTASAFYEEVMGLELVDDQEWAKIYRVNGNAYLGIVDEKRGFLRAQEKSAVLITFVTDDVLGWYEYLKSKGVKILTELQKKEDIQVQCFFFEDPGGYALEIQRFLKPDLASIFQGSD
jgi:predicted enzyme related to lactoylglutathione lyase